jgi:hypothetical protein
MDYYKKYQSQEWVDIQNEIEEDENSASIMDEFRDNNNLKTKTMEAINKLREYANLRDDWYINSQLDLLEAEIKIAKNNAKIQVYNEINNNKK